MTKSKWFEEFNHDLLHFPPFVWVSVQQCSSIVLYSAYCVACVCVLCVCVLCVCVLCVCVCVCVCVCLIRVKKRERERVVGKEV